MGRYVGTGFVMILSRKNRIEYTRRIGVLHYNNILAHLSLKRRLEKRGYTYTYVYYII